MKLIARFSLFAFLFAGAAFAQTCPTNPVVTPTTHLECLAWTWSQGQGAPASQFNIMRSTSAGGCTQTAPVAPSTTPTFPAGCTQVGVVPVTQLNFVDQGNSTTNILTEAKTYCWVVVAQGANGAESGNSPESCNPIPLASPAAPSGLTGVAK